MKQIMDGSPSRGETIPIRLFLGGFDLTPTFREVNKKYSTRYYLSLVLIDEGKQKPAIMIIIPLTPCRCTKIFQAIRNCSLSPTTRNRRCSGPANPDHRRSTAGARTSGVK